MIKTAAEKNRRSDRAPASLFLRLGNFVMCLAVILLVTAAYAAADSEKEPVSPGYLQFVATLELQPPVPINHMLFGVSNTWAKRGMRPDDPDLVEALELMQVGALRFPGGEVSSYFDLISGRFVSQERILGFLYPVWSQRYRRMSRNLERSPRGKRSFKSFEFMTGLLAAQHDMKVKPLWVFNPITRSSRELAETVENFYTSQTSIAFVEMGNAIEKDVFRRDLPSARDYVNRVYPAIRRIREHYGKAKIALCADGEQLLPPPEEPLYKARKPVFDAREEQWNNVLYRYRELYDAWSVRCNGCNPHLFHDIPRDQWDDLILAYPDIAMTTWAKRSRFDYDNLPIWVTEYNLPFQWLHDRERIKHPVADAYLTHLINSPLHGLHVVGYILSAIRHQDIFKVLFYSSLTGDDGFAMTHVPGTEQKDSTVLVPVKEASLFVTPAGQMFAQLAHIARLSDNMHPIRVEGGPRLFLDIPGGYGIPALQAAAFSATDRMILVLFNRSSIPAVAAFNPGKEVADGVQLTFSADSYAGSGWAEISRSEAMQWPWERPIIPEKILLELPSEPPIPLVIPGHSLSIIEMTYPQ